MVGVQSSDVVRLHAVMMFERYNLRPAQALQLAGALQWCEYRTEGRVFLTADLRLREVALRSGFEVGLVS
jgi:hypothetical protein